MFDEFQKEPRHRRAARSAGACPRAQPEGPGNPGDVV